MAMMMGDHQEGAHKELEISIDEEGRARSPYNGVLEYRTRVVESGLGSWSVAALDALRMDCTVADMPLLARTFWLSGGDAPRCALEAVVQAILRFHAPAEALAMSGAEWWVQKRPSGRESILLGDDEETLAAEDPTRRAKRSRALATLGPRSQRLDWHFDKDEELRAGTGLFLAPQLSTVTYLCDRGGPTVVLDCAPHPPDGEPRRLDYQPLTEGVTTAQIAFPATGRHLVFDGRKMHAVVPALQRLPASRSLPRLTLLVNVWINHKPLAIRRLPDAVLPQLSKLHDPPFVGSQLSLSTLFPNPAHNTSSLLQPVHVPADAPRLALHSGADAPPPRILLQVPTALADFHGPAICLDTSGHSFVVGGEQQQHSPPPPTVASSSSPLAVILPS